MAVSEVGLKFYQSNVAATKSTRNVSSTEKFALEKAGSTEELSEKPVGKQVKAVRWYVCMKE